MLKLTHLALCLALLTAAHAEAQLIGEPAIPPRADNHAKGKKPQHEDFEWLWQYSPPPVNGREHELIQDPNFQPFLAQYMTTPQSFWGPQTEGQRKTLAQTAYDFLTIPGKVIAEGNRYITVTGSVFRRRTSRGFLFVDLNDPHPPVVFAAIEWIRDSKPTDDPDAEYTLWIFPSHVPMTPGLDAQHLPSPLAHSLARWLAEPIAGTEIVQHVTHAILVDPDGTPHQISVPRD